MRMRAIAIGRHGSRHMCASPSGTFPYDKFCESGGDAARDIPKVYNPGEVEKGWYDWWSGNDYFDAHVAARHATGTAAGTADTATAIKCGEGVAAGGRPTFSMVLPPPNVTGVLHIGHALTVTIQDAMARWRRMRGERVVWIPFRLFGK